jgi:hypothetical protein
MGHSASPPRNSLLHDFQAQATRSYGHKRVSAGLLLLAAAAVSCGSDASTTDGSSTATQTWTAATTPAVSAGAGAVSPVTTTAGVGATAGTWAKGQTGVAGGGAVAMMTPTQAVAGAAAAPGAGAAGAMSAAAGHDAAMGHTGIDCLIKNSVDARDDKLTDEPLVWEGSGQKDLLVPQLVLDWMGENEFESAHDGWHLVRKWDQSCFQSNASADTCLGAQRLQSQGLERAPVQQGAAGDGLAFMAMHRHMIHMLKETFPKHAKLFDGFTKVPRTTEDKENPVPGHRLSWAADNVTGFDVLENIEKNLSMFPSEDDLGNYIENTYRWTAQSPMQPTSQAGSGLHGVLHSQWAVNGSPGNLIEQDRDVRNFTFWKLHGWIDNVWERYRVAKGLKNEDAAYVKIMTDQCNEMFYLKMSNRNLPMQPTGTSTTGPGNAMAETGYFAKQVRPALDATCGGCHSALGPSAGLTLGGMNISSAEVLQGLVGKKSTNGEYNLIEPGAPEKSWVYLKATGDSMTVMCTSACGRGKMPPSGDGLSDAQLQSLKKWIMDGATSQ